MQNACPHCGKPALSFWRRQWLGRIATPCRSCGKPISMGPWSWLAVLPFVAAIIVANHVAETWGAKALWWTAGFVLMSAVHARLPLVKR